MKHTSRVPGGTGVTALVGVALALALAGCGTINKWTGAGKEPDYKQSRSLPPLEVPPDLTSSTIDDTRAVPDITPSSTASYSDYAGERSGPGAGGASPVLPDQEDIELERDRDRHWLVVEGQPEAVWNSVRNFWLDSGFLLTLEDPRIGIMETDWAENRADIPQGPIRNVLGKALDTLYSAGTRDKFRVRLERGREPGTTEVYLTHRGMEEVVQGAPDESTGTVWRPRPSDPELEAEMLKRLMVHMGVAEQRAEHLARAGQEQPAPRARLVRDAEGATTLELMQDFPRAWRSTGIALDRTGFAVEDRDRSQGIYYVRYIDPGAGEDEGWLSSLAFWRDEPDPKERYQIRVMEAGDELTRVEVFDENGEPERSDTARQILNLLHEELR